VGTNKPVCFNVQMLQFFAYKSVNTNTKESSMTVVGQVKTYQTKLQTLFGLKFMVLKIK
jgi:hypothetical protein